MIDLGQGACRDIDPGVFFPNSEVEEAHARSVCSRCTVRLDCLALALSTPRMEGVWGGLTARERRRLKVVPTRVA